MTTVKVPAAKVKPEAKHVLRLRMKPATGTGHVDGGWWPWSTDPAAEFPALIEELTARLGPISRMGYHLDTWNTTSRKLIVQGHVVKLEGFRAMEPDTVTVTGLNRKRVTLLVVPASTAGGPARSALRAASVPDSTATVEDILKSNGAR